MEEAITKVDSLNVLFSAKKPAAFTTPSGQTVDCYEALRKYSQKIFPGMLSFCYESPSDFSLSKVDRYLKFDIIILDWDRSALILRDELVRRNDKKTKLVLYSGVYAEPGYVHDYSGEKVPIEFSDLSTDEIDKSDQPHLCGPI